MGAIACIYLKMACNSKKAGGSVKLGEIIGTRVYRVQLTFSVQVILESFDALVLKWPVARQRLAVEPMD